MVVKRWKKYEDFLLRGDWHIHTNYTDGQNTVFEICETAVKNGLEMIAFSEHVNKVLDYNFDNFLSDIYSARDKFDLKILVGCEAKVLDLEGNIDVEKDVLKSCEIVLGVFHSFLYQDKDNYMKTLKNMLKNPDVDIWGHPTLFTHRHMIQLNKDDILDIVTACMENEVLIERNLNYGLPTQKFIDIVLEKKWKFVIGSDSHRTLDLPNKELLKRVRDQLTAG